MLVFVVPKGQRGPSIDSKVEDLVAKWYKRTVIYSSDGRIIIELQNENGGL